MRQSAPYRRRRSWSVLAAGFLLATLLLAAESAFSQDPAKGSSRRALRKDPLYPRLYHDGKAFLALPEEKQRAMRKLHADLEKLAPAERDWLKDVLSRYVDWLERLPETSRQAMLDAPDAATRLKVINQLREKEWIAHLPRATQKQLSKLPSGKAPPAVAAFSTLRVLFGSDSGPRSLMAAAVAIAGNNDLREDAIKSLKKTESRKARDWMIAARHWEQLTAPNRPEMPSRPADFGESTETFIKEYLLPALSGAEKDRLLKAEGRWPLYPLTLVELADKHPMALPQRNGPTTFDALPADVKLKFTGKAGKKGEKVEDKGKKNWDQIFAKNVPKVEARLEKIPLRNPTDAIKFACAAATYIHNPAKKAVVKMPHELWAAKPQDMSQAMQVFLDEQGPFMKSLTANERSDLSTLKGLWPEYPLRVQELAGQNGFRPPWQSLPEFPNKGNVWDKYRPKSQNKLEG